MTSEGDGEARRLTPEGAPAVRCARYLQSQLRVARGFGTFQGIVCREPRHWRMIHGASHPNAGSGSV